MLSDIELLWEEWSRNERGVSMDCSPHFKSRNCVGKWTSEDIGPQFDTSHVENESFVAGLPRGGDPQNEFLERDPLFEQEWDCFEDF